MSYGIYTEKGNMWMEWDKHVLRMVAPSRSRSGNLLGKSGEMARSSAPVLRALMADVLRCLILRADSCCSVLVPSVRSPSVRSNQPTL